MKKMYFISDSSRPNQGPFSAKRRFHGSLVPYVNVVKILEKVKWGSEDLFGSTVYVHGVSCVSKTSGQQESGAEGHSLLHGSPRSKRTSGAC